MKKRDYLFLTVSAFALVACGGGSSGTSYSGGASITLPTTYSPDSGRLLGSVGCAQCHGTNGVSVTSWDSIAGEGEFAEESFREYPIMHAIASGYNSSEKSIIDGWLNNLSSNGENDNEEENDDD